MATVAGLPLLSDRWSDADLGTLSTSELGRALNGRALTRSDTRRLGSLVGALLPVLLGNNRSVADCRLSSRARLSYKPEHSKT